MAKKSTTSPVVVLGCGVVAIVLMGVGVWWLSETTPVVKLRPELEKQYGVHGIHCSLHLKELRLDVEPPSSLALDRLGLRRLGGITFRHYLRLTKGNTQVATVRVIGTTTEDVSRDASEKFFMADDLSDEMHKQAATLLAPIPAADIHLAVAPATTAGWVQVEAPCDERAAQRVADMLARMPGVSVVEVRDKGKTIALSGADAKLLAPIAGVGSR